MDIKQLLWQKKTYETYNTRIPTEETNKRQIKHKEFIVSSCTKKRWWTLNTYSEKKKQIFLSAPFTISLPLWIDDPIIREYYSLDLTSERKLPLMKFTFTASNAFDRLQTK